MTHDAHPTHDQDAAELHDELTTEEVAAEADYEEISSDEVDMIVSALESLIDSTSSENIRAYLDEAAENIYRLVYDDADESSDWEASGEDELSEAA